MTRQTLTNTKRVKPMIENNFPIMNPMIVVIKVVYLNFFRILSQLSSDINELCEIYGKEDENIKMEIYCKDCGQKLTIEDQVCSNCGSKKKHIELSLEDKIGLHDQIGGKVKRPGSNKPTQEFKVGDDFHCKSGKWYYREMYIDRDKDQYKEIIKHKITGEIIHKCEEPLSEHRGHGSAKYKKSN